MKGAMHKEVPYTSNKGLPVNELHLARFFFKEDLGTRNASEEHSAPKGPASSLALWWK